MRSNAPATPSLFLGRCQRIAPYTGCHTRRMNIPPIHAYRHHRFPAQIISHGVWRYDRVRLSDRDVEELLLTRGVSVSYEAVRRWCRTFGQKYAHQLRRQRPKPVDKWHLDEVSLTINGERQSLWRAIDQEGHSPGDRHG
jgi:transposase-like protein